MNVVLIIIDTLRQDHVGCYGNEWIKTPYLDSLAKESVLFTRAYAAVSFLLEVIRLIRVIFLLVHLAGDLFLKNVILLPRFSSAMAIAQHL